MKNTLAAAAFILTLAACTKNAGPALVQAGGGNTNATDTTSRGILKYRGLLTPGAEGTVTGQVKIYAKDSTLNLWLDSFMVTSGPDLHVYLASEVPPIHFIDLGKLQATQGNQLYRLTTVPDFTIFNYAVIHCQQYNVVFGSAKLN